MGYDFHITRRRLWHDEGGPVITAEEWLRLVEGDPELELDPRNGPYFAVCERPDEEAHWLDWRDGELFTKNPDDWFVRKMQALAERLGARVQGDEAEVYDGEYPPPEPPAAQPSRWAEGLRRVARWVHFLLRRRPPRADQIAFRVGDRVRNPWGVEGTVVAVDRWAEFGYGRIRVRLADGSEQSSVLLSPLWERIDQPAGCGSRAGSREDAS